MGLRYSLLGFQCKGQPLIQRERFQRYSLPSFPPKVERGKDSTGQVLNLTAAPAEFAQQVFGSPLPPLLRLREVLSVQIAYLRLPGFLSGRR